jgi:hypothetical protein
MQLVRRTQALGHEDVDALTREFLRGPPEELLDAGIRGADEPAAVDDEEAVW